MATKSAQLVSAIGKGRSLLSLSRGYASAAATLPDLPYDYNALSPVIIPEIMELHHKKHHQAYITNLNASLEKYAEAEHKGDLKTMIALQPAIKFNGGGALCALVNSCVDVVKTGARRCAANVDRPTLPFLAGHLNHAMFWQMLIPPKVRLQNSCLYQLSVPFYLSFFRRLASPP
jgi:superoxide dismutase